MSKTTNRTAGKGILDLDFNAGKGTITLVDKDGGETVWDFFEILEMYNGRSISYSFAEDVEIEPLEQD